jgi:hypothetical protein
VIERFFDTLKYEHVFRGVIADGDVLDVEVQNRSITGIIGCCRRA